MKANHMYKGSYRNTDALDPVLRGEAQAGESKERMRLSVHTMSVCVYRIVIGTYVDGLRLFSIGIYMSHAFIAVLLVS
jgi:hypothetical protein